MRITRRGFAKSLLGLVGLLLPRAIAPVQDKLTVADLRRLMARLQANHSPATGIAYIAIQTPRQKGVWDEVVARRSGSPEWRWDAATGVWRNDELSRSIREEAMKDSIFAEFYAPKD